MKLYLVRHGKARKGGKDRLRPLTKGGIEEIEALAGFLSRTRVRVGTIWHSDRVRAIETARIVSKAVKGKLVQRRDIGPDDPPGPLARRIRRARQDLMIVGHLPHLGRVASKLLAVTASREVLTLHTGSIGTLIRDDAGRWTVEWLIGPEQI